MPSATLHKCPAADAEEIHRHAYNAAFCDLGLRWHWDANIYRDLLSIAEDRDRVRVYVETHQPHLLKAYEADFLIDAIQAAKTRCYGVLVARQATDPHNHDWEGLRSLEVAA